MSAPRHRAAALVVLLLGACCAGQGLMAERISTLWGVNGPRLRRYADADPALKADPTSKGDLMGRIGEMDRAAKEGSVAAAAAVWFGLGPKLRIYLAADPALDADSRRIRLESVDRMDEVAREAKGGGP